MKKLNVLVDDLTSHFPLLDLKKQNIQITLMILFMKDMHLIDLDMLELQELES